jgi:hypothetical protein
MSQIVLVLVSIVVAGLMGQMVGATPGELRLASEKSPGAAPPRFREPAVAGLFYPAEPAALARQVDELLAGASVEPLDRLRAIVAPHAGYPYSGPTAAHAYKLLAGRDVRTVVLMAPSHYALFQGVSVARGEAYRTPLGAVRMSEKSPALAEHRPFVWEPRCSVRRPGWWSQSSRPAPARDEETPETWEHAGEVHVPFLQRTLKDFELLSLVFGEADPAEAARGLAALWDARTVIIASSDLSHYHPYEDAKRLDQRCVKAIVNLELEHMKAQEACGKSPVLTLLHLAKQKGWKGKLLDYRNSGDTAGDKQGVVGYAAVAFYEPPAAEFDAAERRQLIELARQTLREVVVNGRTPEPDPKTLPRKFLAERACFVTLTKQGRLRGCIGHLTARDPLYLAVIDNTRNAALRDMRFPPVQADELASLRVEISLLTEPRPLDFASPDDLLAKLQPHRDGVVLRLGEQSATYLPQVWAQLPDKTEFLNSLAHKAGCAPGSWRTPGATVLTYQTESCKESNWVLGPA